MVVVTGRGCRDLVVSDRGFEGSEVVNSSDFGSRGRKLGLVVGSWDWTHLKWWIGVGEVGLGTGRWV